VFADAAPLLGGNPHAGLAKGFDPGAAARALNDAGITDPLDRQLHIAALKRAIDRAAKA
jgi:carbon-monoxide dehydrogenase medium subunit